MLGRRTVTVARIKRSQDVKAGLRAVPSLGSRRYQSSYEAPEDVAKPNYRQFYRPFTKVFLGAMFTYQVLFWCWEKLRLDEMREEKEAELAGLETQLAAYQDKQKLEKENAAAQTGKKSWFSW